MKHSFLTLLLCVPKLFLGQQETQATHFMINPFLLNPAYSSMDDNIDFKMAYRNQWLGLEDQPRTMYISGHAPINKSRWAATHPGDFHNWHGSGFSLYRDELGPISNTKFNLNYSYNIGFTQGDGYGYNHTDGLRLALGTFLGFNSLAIDKDILSKSKTSLLETIDNPASMGDPTLRRLANGNSNVFDMSLGALLYYGNKYYLGFSTTQLLESQLRFTNASQFSRHYFVSGLYKHKVNEEWYFIPSIILKYVAGAPISTDYNIRIDWQNKVYGGFGYRSRDALTFMLGYEFKWGEKIKHFRTDKHRYRMHVYYSYDLTVSALGARELDRRSKGTHELTIAFLLPPFYFERNAEDTW